VLSLLANLNVRTTHVSGLQERLQTQTSLQFERNKNFGKIVSKGQGLTFISTRDVGFSFNPADSTLPTDYIESGNADSERSGAPTHEVAIRSQTNPIQSSAGYIDHTFMSMEAHGDTFQLKQLDSKANSTAESSGENGGVV